MTALTSSLHGDTLLHIWRMGDFYESQFGDVFRTQWNSFRFSGMPQDPKDPDRYINLVTTRLPIPDQSVDAIYARRIIEHLAVEEVDTVVQDFHRVLKPGGVLRWCAPHFEEICRTYLHVLEQCWQDPSEENWRRYELLAIEYVDQMVRERPGGFMGPSIGEGLYDPALVRERFGDVFESMLSGKTWPNSNKEHKTSLGGLWARARRGLLFFRWGRDPRLLREANRWAYDRYNGPKLCMDNGLLDAKVVGARESSIPHWDEYDFNWSTAGEHEVEPSLYIECKKAAT